MVLIPAIQTSESKKGPEAQIWQSVPNPNIVLPANQPRNLPNDATEVFKT